MDRHQADPAHDPGRADAPGRQLTAAWLAFDLDGTLIDARRRQVEVTAALAGPGLDGRRFWRLKRGGATTHDALLALGFEPARAQAVAEAWPAQMESERWLASDRALPGAARALARLREAGYRIAVLTARRRAAGARLSLEAAGLAALIDDVTVVDPSDAAGAKARALRTRRARSFIGDTDSDGAAARLAEVPFQAVCTGQRSPGYLRAAGYEPVASLHAALAALGI